MGVASGATGYAFDNFLPPSLQRCSAGFLGPPQTTGFDLAHNFRERVDKDFKDVATIFFSAA
jgi:hypothetical protein